METALPALHIISIVVSGVVLILVCAMFKDSLKEELRPFVIVASFAAMVIAGVLGNWLNVVLYGILFAIHIWLFIDYVNKEAKRRQRELEFQVIHPRVVENPAPEVREKIVYIQAQPVPEITMEDSEQVFCLNCGAPVKLNASKRNKCPFCGSNPLKRNWQK